jgi:hypothetical protein
MINALGIEFDDDLTLVELLEEFETVDGIIIPSNIDGNQVRGLRRLNRLKSVVLGFCGEPRRNEIRLPRGVQNIQLFPLCLTDALDFSRFLNKVVPPRPIEKITLTLDMMELIHNWRELKIPNSISTIITAKRRNHPRDFLTALRDQGFRRKSRTEDVCTFERADPSSPEFVLNSFPEEENLLDPLEKEELILKIIKEAFFG